MLFTFGHSVRGLRDRDVDRRINDIRVGHRSTATEHEHVVGSIPDLVVPHVAVAGQREPPPLTEHGPGRIHIPMYT